MTDQTMTDQQLKRNLQTAGMACFVKYFDALTNLALPNPEVVKIVQQHESYADQSCKSRVSHARSVIRAGRTHDALLLIAASASVKSEIAEQAKTLADALPPAASPPPPATD